MICEHAYARGSMLTHAFDLAGDHRAAFSIVLVGNQIVEYALIHPVPSGADVARRLSVMARRRRACRPAHHARRSIPQEGQAPAIGPRRSPNLPCGATRQAGTVNPRRSAAFAEVRRCRQGNKPFCLGRVVICRPHGEMNPPCPRRTALTSNSSPAPGSMITSPASWP